MKIARLLLLAVAVTAMLSSCVVAVRPGYGYGYHRPHYPPPPRPPHYPHGHYHHW